MMPLAPDITARDIQQWLNQGWFFMQDNHGVFTPVQFDFVSEEAESVFYRKGKERKPGSVPVDKVFPHWPLCGCVNMPDGYAVIVVRSMVQQYRRTYNSRCLQIEIPRKWEVMKAKGQELVTSADDPVLVEQVFDPHYYSYSECLSMLDKEWATVAMNPYIILAEAESGVLVYYNGEAVGVIANHEFAPLGGNARTARRLLKFFEGRVDLCASQSSPEIMEEFPLMRDCVSESS